MALNVLKPDPTTETETTVQMSYNIGVEVPLIAATSAPLEAAGI